MIAAGRDAYFLSVLAAQHRRKSWTHDSERVRKSINAPAGVQVQKIMKRGNKDSTEPAPVWLLSLSSNNIKRMAHAYEDPEA